MNIDYCAIGVPFTVVIITTSSAIKIPAWIVVFIITPLIIGILWIFAEEIVVVVPLD